MGLMFWPPRREDKPTEGMGKPLDEAKLEDI
jgi:hypothetical protein